MTFGIAMPSRHAFQDMPFKTGPSINGGPKPAVYLFSVARGWQGDNLK